MTIRITQNTISDRFLSDVQSVYEKMSKTQEQINSGQRITKPSDDPYGTGQVLSYDRQLAEVKQHQDNVASTQEFIGTGEDALSSANSAMIRIKEILTQAKNDTNNTLDRASLAAEATQLKEVVRNALNVQHGGTYVFGGTSGTTQPFPAPGNAYVGSANQMSRVVAPGQSVNIAALGSTVAGPNGANVLDAIDATIADITGSNAAGMIADSNALDAANTTILSTRTQFGAMSSRLESIQDRLGVTEERLVDARSKVAEVDTAEAFTEFSKQQTMYQAALAAGTRMMQTSILDYIR